MGQIEAWCKGHLAPELGFGVPCPGTTSEILSKGDDLQLSLFVALENIGKIAFQPSCMGSED